MKLSITYSLVFSILLFSSACNNKLGSDFTSSFHTGTVTVYLSSSKDLTLSEKESFQLVAVVNEPGEHYFKLANFPDSKFSHGILWCGAAAIPFGFAELK